jgi:DNA-binding NarL/FixJ family response regulator
MGYSREVIPIVKTSFPWAYLLQIADAFEECDDLMVEASLRVNPGIEWTRTQQYLRSVSRAIREQAPEIERQRIPISQFEEETPPIMPFRRLAEIISAEAAQEMTRCTREVVRLCGTSVENPLNDQQIEWMQRLSNGDKVIDIAHAAGYSERTMYRALNDLWQILGVTGRNEAIAVVAEKGWLNEVSLAS